jgi:phosphatidylethanolamine-binding protein (PEBP) family uncharacterized protein
MPARRSLMYLASTMTAPREDSGSSTFRHTTYAFTDGSAIPGECSCEGENRSPPLAWTGVPVSSRRFAIIDDDPDAPRGTLLHWLFWYLPGEACVLSPGV